MFELRARRGRHLAVAFDVIGKALRSGVEGGGRLAGVAGDLRGRALRLAHRAERVVELGAYRLDLALRLPALLPFVAGPQTEAEADDQAQHAGDAGINERLRVADQVHAGEAFDRIHVHTALPGQPAAM